MTFRDLLTAFAAAVEANDGEGLASLFTEDGTYEDGFLGAHTGRPAIAMMLRRFHDTGRAYLWGFLDPLSDGSIGYARFRFSYASLVPKAAGRPVFFEGMSCFRFRDGLTAHYGEAFDRGVAFVQLDFSADRIRHILARAATAQNRNPNVTFIAFPPIERQRVLQFPARIRSSQTNAGSPNRTRGATARPNARVFSDDGHWARGRYDDGNGGHWARNRTRCMLWHSIPAGDDQMDLETYKGALTKEHAPKGLSLAAQVLWWEGGRPPLGASMRVLLG